MVTASYPSGVTSFTTKVDKVDVVDDDHINKLQVEVIALQQYIGTNPHGDRTDFVERFNAMHNPSGYLISSAGVPQPTSPGMIWYDTAQALIRLIQNDGTVKNIGGSLSNAIMSYYDASPTVYATSYKNNANTWGSIIRNTPWTKIAGVNTIRCHAEVAASMATVTTFDFSLGVGATTSVRAGLSYTSYTYAPSWTLDVSGLDNGTAYNIKLETRNVQSSGSATKYLRAFMIEGE